MARYNGIFEYIARLRYHNAYLFAPNNPGKKIMHREDLRIYEAERVVVSWDASLKVTHIR